MTRILSLAGLLLTLAVPSVAHALATESLGNAPIGAGWGFDNKLLTVVNVHSRVYWYEVNGNPFFFFKAETKELNEALASFARLDVEKKEIILVAGAGETKTLGGKPVAFDWCVHVPMGLHFGGDSEVADTRATFTIHIPNPLPPVVADRAKVQGWIADVNSDDFKTRAKATAELEAFGPSVAPAIREALKDKLPADARDRLERVLAQVSGAITLDSLNLPDKIPVVGVESLLERSRKALSDKDSHARGIAASSLVRHRVPAAEILPDLEKVLKEEKDEYPVRCATGSASVLGAEGRPLLPALRALLKSEDKNVVNAAQYAVDAIEKAKNAPADEAEVKKQAHIRKEIRVFVQKRQEKEK
ncbi:MAG TPA: hypothetical protein VKD71_10230 [Gemmataceae bacterium]|nr:hypothetical protein [Gemmataceae bacterium]